LKGNEGLDKSSFGGVFVALGGILLGLALEGGKIGQIVQPTAALIVFGGTLGAVLLQFPLPIVLEAFESLAQVFFEAGENPRLVLKEMVGYAQKARKAGIVSLDNDLDTIEEPFLRKSFARSCNSSSIIAPNMTRTSRKYSSPREDSRQRSELSVQSWA
jgi:chemotaxis protein MotA